MAVLDELVAERRAKLDAEERARIEASISEAIDRSEAESVARIVEHAGEVLAKVAALDAAAAMKDSQ